MSIFTRTVLALLVSLTAALLATVPAFAIAGGRAADPADTPWFVTFDSCGGTLIAADRVLTAAHCVAGEVPADLGPVDVAGAPGQAPRVSAISLHPGFDIALFERLATGWEEHDLAVLRLDRPVSGVRPVQLGTAGAGRPLEVVGRGATGSGTRPGVRGRALRTATLWALSDATCARFWRVFDGGRDRGAFVPRLMLCGQDTRARAVRRRDTCSGDSGGPAFVRTRSGMAVQAGVTSWGAGGCGRGTPSVFAEVAAERSFIERREQPWAPVPLDRPTLTGAPAVGATLTCRPPAWAIAPSRVAVEFLTHRFPDGERVLQRGDATTYVVRETDRGTAIRCRVESWTAGGRVVHHALEDLRVPR